MFLFQLLYCILLHLFKFIITLHFFYIENLETLLLELNSLDLADTCELKW